MFREKLEEAFADHWDHTPRDFEAWSKAHLGSERFDPTLWCVVRAGDEIAAGTICAGDTFGVENHRKPGHDQCRPSL